MYPIKRIRDIRSHELFLFGGVPESAESMYERDSNPYTEIRTTRRSICSATSNKHSAGNGVERVTLNFETGEVTIIDIEDIHEDEQ
jgi:hypothetical protein